MRRINEGLDERIKTFVHRKRVKMIGGEASCIYLGPLRRSLETKGSWLRCFDQERISIVGRRRNINRGLNYYYYS